MNMNLDTAGDQARNMQTKRRKFCGNPSIETT